VAYKNSETGLPGEKARLLIKELSQAEACATMWR
jgi:hypothetical protein